MQEKRKLSFAFYIYKLITTEITNLSNVLTSCIPLVNKHPACAQSCAWKRRLNLMVTTFLLLLFSYPVMSNSLQPHGLQHARPSCPSPSPKVCPSSCPWHRWCHPAISFSDALFSSYPQSFPASGTFKMSQLFSLGDQNTSPSASVLPMNIQGWFPLRLTGLISLQSKRLSGVFSSTTVWRHQFFVVLPSL